MCYYVNHIYGTTNQHVIVNAWNLVNACWSSTVDIVNEYQWTSHALTNKSYLIIASFINLRCKWISFLISYQRWVLYIRDCTIFEKCYKFAKNYSKMWTMKTKKHQIYISMSCRLSVMCTSGTFPECGMSLSNQCAK